MRLLFGVVLAGCATVPATAPTLGEAGAERVRIELGSAAQFARGARWELVPLGTVLEVSEARVEPGRVRVKVRHRNVYEDVPLPDQPPLAPEEDEALRHPAASRRLSVVVPRDEDGAVTVPHDGGPLAVTINGAVPEIAGEDQLSPIAIVLRLLSAAAPPPPPGVKPGDTWTGAGTDVAFDDRLIWQERFTLLEDKDGVRRIAVTAELRLRREGRPERAMHLRGEATLRAGRLLPDEAALEIATPPEPDHDRSPSGFTPVRTLRVARTDEPLPAPPPDPSSSPEQLAAWEARARADYTRPWAERRGLEWSDQGIDLILVDAPPDRVSSALAAGGLRREADVLGRTVPVGRAAFWVYRVEGHRFTTVAPLADSSLLPAEALAAALSARVLRVLAYEEELLVQVVEPTGAKREIASYDEADALLKDLGAYVEGSLSGAYFFSDGRTEPRLRPGELRPVRNPGLVLQLRYEEVRSVPPLERIDYVFAP